MMNKKAQLTLFIVTALIIIFFIGGFLLFKKTSSEVHPIAIPVQSYVQSCIDETVTNGINYSTPNK